MKTKICTSSKEQNNVPPNPDGSDKGEYMKPTGLKDKNNVALHQQSVPVYIKRICPQNKLQCPRIAL